jgi:hypothetical protein
MADPKAVHVLPRRYRDWFREVRTNTEDGLRWFFWWECRVCGQRIKPNTAGAQSHVAKHVRENDSRKTLAEVFAQERRP